MERFISKENFSISHNTDYKSEASVSHSHDEIEIYIHISGGKYFFVDDVIYDIKKKDIILFDSSQIHKVIKNPNEIYERYIIVYKKEFLMSLGSDFVEINSLISRISKNKENILRLNEKNFDKLIKLLEEYDNNQIIANNLYKLSKFLEIMIVILSEYNRKSGKNEKNKIMKDRYVNNQTVNEIIEKINLYYKDNDFTVAKLSSILHISKCYMCDVFKKNTGITILGYINQKKIIEAKAMLTEGKSIVNCTDCLGFNSYNDFIRVFKKTTGDTPKKYLKKNIR